MATTIRVSIINESKLVTPAEVQSVAAALQRQVSEHFAPAWGVDATISFVAPGTKPLSGSWWLVILDDAGQAGTLGYQDLTDEAMPLGKVFVKTARDAGVKWTVTASHELLELLADSSINLSVCTTENGRLMLYAYEICDPCQADEFGYAIDGVTVSDFLFPTWFETFHRSAGAVPFDYRGRIGAPFALLPGGYAGVLDTTNAAAGWAEKRGPATTIAGAHFTARPAVEGSRRERRRRGAAGWIASELENALAGTGAAAVTAAAATPAGVATARAGAAAATWPPPLAAPRLLRQPDAAGKSILHIERPGAQSNPVSDEIKAMVDKLEAASRAGNAPPRAQSVIAALKAALDQTAPSKPVDTLKSAQPHQLQLSLLAAAMTSEAPPARPMSAIDAKDFYHYGNFDPGWLGTFFHLLESRPLPFSTHVARNISPIVRIGNAVTIAIAGDWGTGNASSRSIAQRIADLRADHTIHLGDIYLRRRRKRGTQQIPRAVAGGRRC